jgi:hypothetical protein
MARLVIFFWILGMLNYSKAASQLRFTGARDTSNKKISLKVLPQNFYIQQLGFFCKKEAQVQKLTTLPLFIRLGSKDYVDYLEKKPNSITGKKD